MNKKYIAAGLCFWIAVSGYMAVRILNSYTEDAVAASLASVPAHAERIKYSILNNRLEIHNLEYEIPDEHLQRKGSITHLTISDFNRKILFVMPAMPEYDPDALPRAAGLISAEGIKESLHKGYNKLNYSASSVVINGWRQRLGLVFDRYARGGGKSFWRELLRCECAYAEINGFEGQIEDSRYGDAASFHMGRMLFPDGIKAPQKEEWIAPLHAVAENISGSGKNVSMALTRLEVESFLPAYFFSLINDSMTKRQGKRLLEALNDSEAAPAYMRVNAFGGGISDVQAGAGIKIEHGAFSVNCTGDGPVIKISADAPNALALSDIAKKKYFGLQAMSLLDGGMKASFNLKGEAVRKGAAVNAQCLIHDSATINASASIEGDVARLLSTLALGHENKSSIFKQLSAFYLDDARLEYVDSGYMARVVAKLAKRSGMNAADFCDAVKQKLDGLMQTSQEELIKNAAAALKEQMDTPGSVTAALKKGIRPTLAQLVLAAVMQPYRLPVTITSAPGAKPLSNGF